MQIFVRFIQFRFTAINPSIPSISVIAEIDGLSVRPNPYWSSGSWAFVLKATSGDKPHRLSEE